MAAIKEGTLDLGRWTVDRRFLEDYLGATFDASPIYDDLGAIPPLALAARAIGALLEELALPAGTVHAAQELDCRRLVKLGEEVTCMATLSRPSKRGDWHFISVSFTMAGKDGQVLVGGKSTVLTPASEAGGD